MQCLTLSGGTARFNDCELGWNLPRPRLSNIPISTPHTCLNSRSPCCSTRISNNSNNLHTCRTLTTRRRYSRRPCCLTSRNISPSISSNISSSNNIIPCRLWEWCTRVWATDEHNQRMRTASWTRDLLRFPLAPLSRLDNTFSRPSRSNNRVRTTEWMPLDYWRPKLCMNTTDDLPPSS